MSGCDEGRPADWVLVDTHAHLEDSRFQEDLPQVLARAYQAGVRAIVTCGSSLESSRQALQLAQRFAGQGLVAPRLWVAVGIHPHEAARVEDMEAAMAELRELARHPAVVAIGEIGLDYHYGLDGRDRQRELFARQLELAKELGLPVIVHSREAVEDVLAHLKHAGCTRGVLHAFNGTQAQAQQAVELGLHVGVGGMVTFRSAEPLRQLVRQLPLQRLLVETDAPYLTPVPLRGRRNEPAFVRYVAEELARRLGVPPEELARATTANALRLFGRAHQELAAQAAGWAESPP